MRSSQQTINERKALQIINKIKEKKQGQYQITSLIDTSQGVDQQVKVCTFIHKEYHRYKKNTKKKDERISQEQVIVIKHPKQEYDKILNERIGCKYAANNGVPVPQIYYFDKQFLAQQFIEGSRLSNIRTNKKNFSHLYKQLGQYLKKIHINVGTGFGKLKNIDKLAGENRDKRFMLKNFQEQVKRLQESEVFSPKFISCLKKFLVTQIRFLIYQQNYTSLLHGDYYEDNIIATEKQIKGVIDFGDLCMGAPMQDFARLYVNHYGTNKWDSIVQGYGGKDYIDMMQLQFYVIYLCLWQINGLLQKGINGGKLRKLQKAVKRIIKYKN